VLYAGGNFTTAGGTTSNHLAGWHNCQCKSGLQYGTGLGGANVLHLAGTGSAFLGIPYTATTTNIVGPSSFMVLATARGYIPFGGGVILIDLLGSPSVALALPSVAGTSTLSFTFPNNTALIGVSVFLQAIAFDGSQPAGLALSNGLQVVSQG
jgi:hypothetical protein